MLNSLTDFNKSFSAIDLAGRTCAVVAVSGGGDSLALLFLLHDYVKQHSDIELDLLAVTVDHGLRSEAADEARQVAALCARSGIRHRTMKWQTTKPLTGIPEAGREARQHLLAEAALDAGTDLVFLAHTADDQAETTHMRMARGGGRGLAGIAPATLYGDRVWFIRPLLEARRSELRNFLDARSVRWIDDPTNIDLHYERARVRQSLNEDDISRLLGIATVAGETRERLGAAVADAMREHVRRCSPGLLRLSKASLQDMPRDAAIYLMRIVLAIAGGAQHLPDQERAAELLEQMLRGSRRATLSRAVVSSHRDRLYLYREHRNLPRQHSCDGLLWDRRYRVSAAPLGLDFSIAAIGEEAALQVELADCDIPNSVARAALAAEPALWHGDELVQKTIAQIEWTPVMGPWATLIPSFDYEPASAMSVVLGCGKLPERPWRRHKQG